MKDFIVLSYTGQLAHDEFEYNFVKAHNENDAYEIIDEEGIGYPGTLVTNCLIEITDSNIERFEKMIGEIKKK
jgi:hypothetical protein